MNKNFSFEFTKTENGWLDFEIHIQNATFHYFFSDDISTQPEELIIWLEKIYNKDYCEFECETDFSIFREFETTEELDIPLSSSFDSLDSEGKKSMILKYASHIEGYNGNELHKIQPEVLENLLKANTQN